MESGSPLDGLHLAGDGFVVTVGEGLCGAGGWLFGGWALGLLTEAMQRQSTRRVQDLAVSFLRPVAAGDRLHLRGTLLAAGQTLGHYRVEALDRGGRPMLAGIAVVGPGAGGCDQAEPPPAVPPPQECPERPYLMEPGTGVSTLLDVRVAGERLDAGVGSTMLLWGRLRCDVPDEVRLAVLSDHVPYLLRRSLPALTRASTVNGSVRVTGGPVPEWVLFDVRLDAVGRRSALGRSAMWSADGRLLAMAEQTARLSWTSAKSGIGAGGHDG